MTGHVSFLEIGTRNASSSQKFFCAMFGWTYQSMGDKGGWFQTPTLKAGLHGEDPEPQLYVYFSVPDIAAAVAQVRALGGEAEDPTAEEPGFGRFSNCRDPQGIRFGLHQPDGVNGSLGDLDALAGAASNQSVAD